MSKTPDDPSDGPIEGAALKVISNLYGAVADGADYEPMFLAMDEVIDQVLGAPEVELGADVLEPMLLPHFDRAAHVFDVMSRQEAETPLTFVDNAANATAILDHSGRIIAANPSFEENFAGVGSELLDHLATPGDQARFQALTRANAPDAQAILNATRPDDGDQLSLLAGVAPGVKMPRKGSSAIYVMMVKPIWGPKTADLLRVAYNLNTAEIEILRSFVKTGSVQGVADERNRSIRTVRTQLSRIFAQMGITGQTGLALFLATLGGLVRDSEDNVPSEQDGAGKSAAISAATLVHEGHRIEYYDFGDPKGVPVLLVQSSHPPGLTEPLRVRLYEAGLRVIAPLKPGSGRSDTVPGRPGPEKLAPSYAALLAKLNVSEVIVAGQASGGLYALEFASQYPKIAQGVCLIDTGVPFRQRSELMALHKTVRRTMVPARYFPDLLYLPHKLVAANFRRSPSGEARVVDYFFAGSPLEQEMTQTRRDAYEYTRDLIAYSFDDTDRLVEDVSRWVKDWSDLLEGVAASHPIAFVHGARNSFFALKRVEDWAAGADRRDVFASETGGQLAILERPDLLVEGLLSLIKSGST